MACNSLNFSYKSQVPGATGVSPGQALSSDDSVYLIVSNNPETGSGTPPASPIILYRGSTTLPSGTKRFRLFFWHISQYQVTATYGLMLRCVSGGTVSDISRDEFVVDWNDPSDFGACLADSQLNGTLTPIAGSMAITAGGTTVWSANAPAVAGPNKLIACVMEFDVAIPAGATLDFQTYVSFPNQSRPTFNLPVAPLDGGGTLWGHVRGWWPRAAMRIKMIPELFDVNPSFTNPLYAHCGVCEDPVQNPEAPEVDPVHGFPKLDGPGHAEDTNNRGAYGVNLTYVGTLSNSSTAMDGRGYITIRARNVAPFKYWGCAHVSVPAQFWQSGKIRKIPWNWELPDDANAFDLLELSAAPPPYLVSYVHVGKTMQGQPPTSVEVEVRVANGGAATLPVGLYRFRSNLLTEPIGGPPD